MFTYVYMSLVIHSLSEIIIMTRYGCEWVGYWFC